MNPKDTVINILGNRKKCQFCGANAVYDGRTVDGPWAYMCQQCMYNHGVGLGLGRGQRLK
jgi:hypothetical protein